MSENQRTDRLEERIAGLEKRCAMLERHYAPTPKNEPSIPLEKLVRLTNDPCGICVHLPSGYHPCSTCSMGGQPPSNWSAYDGELPTNFKLHEDLR